ncbi:putative MFS family arabinose efflux permease [Pseudonocardia hierapolitana]|uniref:Putative MFS family arabinose efflux permease n=1 Tax=Pseudonocardia hierapolitana TaxID=1128676 RepID=A0A561T4T7_9PSEU|nr:MFS transporter [Pseudonocardia hierapolitana]TWF82131.1 putative MFS family arabinose efflux permease [Pseudonocardia hierapolitana]
MRSPRPRRDAVASATGAGIYSVSLGAASVALPLLALQAGYSAFEIGALTAASAVSQMLIRLALGWAMRRWPDWTLIAGAEIALAASCAVVTLSTTLVPFVLAQLLQGVSRACFWTGSQTHVVRGSGRAAGALAQVNLVASVGLLAGPLVAGVLSETTPVLALTVAAGIALTGLAPTLLLDRLPPFAPPADRPPGRMWRRPGVDVGCWAGMTAGAWRALLTSYVPVALDAARQSATTIGVLVAAANGAQLLGTALAGRIRAHLTVPALLVGILATGVATAFTAAVAGSPPLAALVLVVSGMAAGAVQVLGPALAAESVHPQERGEAIAVTGTFRAAALLTAPLAVAGMVVVVPLTPAIAVVGAGMTLPALALRKRGTSRGPTRME